MKISFIGGGNMAGAIIGGLKQKGFNTADINVVELDAAKRAQLTEAFGVQATEHLPSVVNSDVIVLAVKPQQLRDLAIFLASFLKQQLIISIAAGISCAALSRWLNGYSAIVRVMPNTPAQIQAGVSGLYAAEGVSMEQREQANLLLSAAGSTLWLDDESKIDAVTAISGSGPAYVFYFIEALEQAALELGFDPEQARSLSLQTFLGASKLASQSDSPAATLRSQVTSKGGTTERAIQSMEQANIKQAIIQAAHAAAERARELGEQLGKD
ncbi:pyrroline-5-carboxylate reductase [Methylobacillus arboreus]|uniref:pyrroline-5-carboxylate reductase n=1 Tax=Methylobacillus arboreus TaxID=755170 RepID=UPI001E5DC92B|nr:pyrroline-5-carboxylate reductase [Methylobacillus arboreus]MCB5190318.1 pyrroline-5-carboxylate reductase [Methylobacillus arboreus]